MFVETPEARALPLSSVPEARTGERFVITLHHDGLWEVEDRHGTYSRRLFSTRHVARIYVQGIQTYLAGNHATAGALLAKTTYAAQHPRGI